MTTALFLMSHGLTNKMIARQLSIAPETVKSHAKRIKVSLAQSEHGYGYVDALDVTMIVLIPAEVSISG